ncbi:MAG: hypothetical protein HY824_14545, partial [Acidobacteria bacterium]|nr:hypothetical protein [Acidobacteriota bacterium]
TAVAFNQEPVVRVPGAVYDSDVPNEKPGPAPRRDLSGIWEPARGPGDAIGAQGAKNFPDTGRPEHQLPFTPAGLKANLANKPAWGPRAVASAESNDPQPTCEPQGWPRLILHNYRTAQIAQTPKQVLVLYQFNRKWRNIWTDGRPLPKIDDALEPRWWGYSIGRWQDDYTFVAETVGLDERTWLDNVGRPHSFDLRVEERYVRRNATHIEVTITIDDPTYYSRPWIALDRLPLRLQPDTFDIREMDCSPSEFARYTREFAEPAAGVQNTSPR